MEPVRRPQTSHGLPPAPSSSVPQVPAARRTLGPAVEPEDPAGAGAVPAGRGAGVDRRRCTAALVARLGRCPSHERARLQEQLILLNQGVADSLAARYAGRGVAAEDVRQVACEALVKAVRRFDPTAGKDLLSFAVPTITGEIKRYFRDHGWAVRPPRRVQELQQRLGPVVDALRHELDREPTPEEVAGRLDVGLAEYESALAAYGCFSPLSLDQPRTETGSTLADGLQADDGSAEAAEARVMLEPLVRELPLRDRRILYLRFFEDRTQAEIGEDLGITQTQVSRLLSGIYGTLRDSLEPGGGVRPTGLA